MKPDRNGREPRRTDRSAAPGGGPIVDALSLTALFALALLAIAVNLAPMALRSAPDLLFCVLAIWAGRRPGATPALVTFALGLTRDMLGGAPVGAGAFGLLIGVEGMRRTPIRMGGRGIRGWFHHWGAAAVWAAAPVAVPWALLTISFAAAPTLTDIALRYAATVLAFPLIALATRWAAPVCAAGRPAEGRHAYGQGV